MSILRAAAVLPLLLPLSCGYQVGGLYEHRDVKVEIFDTQSDRRTHEFDLTNAVVHEMAARGIRVNAKEAPVTLRGRISDIRTPAVVDQTKTDVVLVGSLFYDVEIELVDNGTGRRLWSDRTSESVSFTSRRGQSLQSARAEIFDRLARWVVTRLEKEW
jgi:hypothetical protein